MPSSYKRELAMEMGSHRSGSMTQKEVEMEGGPDPDDKSHFTKRQQNSLGERRSDLEKDESLLELNGSQMRGKPHQLDKIYFTVENLLKAAVDGDVKFLRIAVHNQSSLPPEYFLSVSRDKSNIIHLAAKGGHRKFIREALGKLPTPTTLSLLCGEEGNQGNTPLHLAAYRRDVQLAKLLVEIVNKRRQWFEGAVMRFRDLPWWARNYDGKTPVQAALWEHPQPQAGEIALLFLEVDTGLFDELDDRDLERLSLEFRHKGDRDRFHNVLLKHPKVISNRDRWNNKKCPVLHELLEGKVCRVLDGKVKYLHMEDEFAAADMFWPDITWPIEMLDNIIDIGSIIDAFYLVNDKGDTPLHVAAQRKAYSPSASYLECLLDLYERAKGRKPLNSACGSLWTIKNKNGSTPLHLALHKCSAYSNIERLMKVISEDRDVCFIRNNYGESPLFIAVQRGLHIIVQKILELFDDRELIGMPLNKDEQTVLHLMPFCEEKTGQLLAERFWWLVKATDRYGKTAIQVAKEGGVEWAVRLLSSSASNLRRFDYVAASEGAHYSSILAFENLFNNCLEANDTPLHHIKVENVEEFLDFLRNPLIQNMKNMCDCDGATPLHRALKRKDILLAELLLTSDGLDESIRDKNQKTAMDLLSDLSNQDPQWEEMCRRIGKRPWERPTDAPLETNHIDVTQETDHPNDALETSHVDVTLETDVTDVPSGTNLFAEMRKPLIALASLLITLSFAAAVTVPGGLNSNTGEAIMAKNAAFSVFVVADAIVFCCSISALFYLILSLSDVGHRMLTSIRHAMLILMLAFNGTLLAFPAGIFIVLFHKSLLLAIVICAICAVVGILMNSSLLLNSLTAGRLTPVATREDRDQSRLLEEGLEFSRR